MKSNPKYPEINNPQVSIDLIRDYFDKLGLRYSDQTEHEIRHDKLHQVVDYLVQIIAAVKKISTKRTVVLVDCGSGMSYLSFAANYYCREILKRDVYFICIDSRADLMDKCRVIHDGLGYGNMEFHESTIEAYDLDRDVDIVYSLHACDIATDQSIAIGLKGNARFIMSVACCQHTMRKAIRMPGITNESKDCKERLGDLVADTMRSKILQSLGYRTRLFEYSTAKYSPKNMMLRAELVHLSKTKRVKAVEEYRHLAATYHVEPALLGYVKEFTGYFFKGVKQVSSEIPVFTSREKECLKCLKFGMTAVQTAKMLSISKRTVEGHIESIKGKLNCDKKSEILLKLRMLKS